MTPPDGPAAIEVWGLVKRYGELCAVDRLDLAVAPGEIVGLVGPNGAGKTTTLRAIAGILPPEEGTIRIGGYDLARDPVRAKRELAYLPDEPRLFDHLTVADHMTLTARLYGVTAAGEKTERLLRELDLAGRELAFPSELSRGMKQKLMVAMALLHDPRALILDEPLTGLDPGAMRRMKERIVSTARGGAGILLSSHLLHLVEELCARVVILARGRVVLEGSLDEIRAVRHAAGEDADLESIFLHATGDARGADGGGTESG